MGNHIFVVDQPERIDKFVASKLEVSRSQIQKAIKQGVVSVNGQAVTEKDFSLIEGDKVELPEIKPEELQKLDLDLMVVYENDYLAVIDKPAGLVVHPGAGHKQDTLANALLHRFPGIEQVGDPNRPGIVHRLDEDTSGLILIAKTSVGFDFLKKLFLEKQVEKQYIALAHGVAAKLHGIIDAPIEKVSTHQKMRVGSGKEAVTEYTVLATKEDGLDPYTLFKLTLHTGRTHQIRVHLAHIGHPIVGDQLYGGSFKKSDLSLLGRQFLHAMRLKLQLSDGTWLELQSQLPKELRETLDKIGIKYDTSI